MKYENHILEGCGIEVVNKNGVDIIEFLESIGAQNYKRWKGNGFDGGFYITRGDKIEYLFRTKSKDFCHTILTLEEAKARVAQSKYPCVMEVRDRLDAGWDKRVVFMEKGGKYLAWIDAQTIEESEVQTYACTWNYARPIQTESQRKQQERKSRIEALEQTINKAKEQIEEIKSECNG